MWVRIWFMGLLFLTHSFGLASIKDHLKPCLDKSDPPEIQGVDFVYLMNLDRRPDRFAYCLQQLRPYGITPYRFSAVDGKSLSPLAFEEIGLRFLEGMQGGQWAITYPREGVDDPTYVFLGRSSYGKSYFSQYMTKGAIGCTLSHLSIVQDAFESGYETIWVLEDDFLIKKDPRTISSYIKGLDDWAGRENWDILFTDYCPAVSLPDPLQATKKHFWFLWRPDVKKYDYASYAEHKFVWHDIAKIGSRNRTHSMIIRRSGMKKILDFELTHHPFIPYDNELSLIPSLQMYAIESGLVTYAPNFSSDIQTR